MENNRSTAELPGELWDKEDIYDEQIYLLMDKIIKICRENNIPMVATFQYCNKAEDDGGQGYCTTALLNGNEHQHMKDLHKASKVKREHFAFAETHITNADGSKVIKIKKIS